MELFKKLSSLFGNRNEKTKPKAQNSIKSKKQAKAVPSKKKKKKKKNKKNKKIKAKNNPTPKHNSVPTTVNQSIDSNVVFSNAYNTLDNFLQNLVNTKENTNLIWHLEQVSILDDSQKSQLKTLRLYKNTIVSHGSVPGFRRPEVPYEWVVFLNDLYSLCLKNSSQLKYELLSILRKQQKHVKLPYHENKKIVQKEATPCDLKNLWTTFLESATKEICEYEHYKIPQMQFARCIYASGDDFDSRYNKFGRNDSMSKPCFDNSRHYAFYEIPCSPHSGNKADFLFLAWDFHGCAIFGEMKVSNIYSFVPVGYYIITKRQYDNYIKKTHYGSDCEFGKFRSGDNTSLDVLRRKAMKVS